MRTILATIILAIATVAVGQIIWHTEPEKSWEIDIRLDHPVMNGARGERTTTNTQHVYVTRSEDSITVTMHRPTLGPGGERGTRMQQVRLSPNGWRQLWPHIERAMAHKFSTDATLENDR